MPLPKGFREWLAKESSTWNSDGLIDGTQRDRILARYPEEEPETGALAYALRTLAALLFGAAVFLVISHNWSDLSREGRLTTVFTALAVIQGLGVFFFLKNQARSAAVGFLLGCLMFGGGIALIGQIYHLDAHSPDAILAWGAFTIPLALILDATILHLLVIVLAGTWLEMEVGHFYAWRASALHHRESLIFLLLLTPTAIAAYARSRPVLTGALAWATMFLWFMFTGGYTLAYLFVLPLALAALHRTGDPRGRGFRFVGMLGTLFITLALGSIREIHLVRDFLRQDYVPALATFGVAIAAVVLAQRRRDSHAAWMGLTAALAIGLCLLSTWLVNHFHQRDAAWVLIVATANVTTLLLAVTLIRQGLAEKRLRPYVYGAVVFLAWLLVRYMDIEKDLGYLGMAGVFAAIGAILFTLAKFWRQQAEPECGEAMTDLRPAWLERLLATVAPHRTRLLAGAVALQFGVLGWMVYDHARPASSGERFLLRCTPVDPRDALKGDYVVLSYDFQQLTNFQKDHLMQAWRAAHPEYQEASRTSFEYAMPKDTAIYFPLSKGADGLARFGEPSLTEPSTGPFLLARKGNSNWTWQPSDIRAGIESYYVPEGTGREWEQLRNEGRLLAEVGVLPNGKAGLISLKTTDSATIRTLRHSTLDRYFTTLKDAKPVTKVIGSREEFAANFHPAPLNGLSAIEPRFPENLVLLHTLPETDVYTTITFQEVGVREGVLTAKVVVKRGGKQTYTIRPQAAIVVPSQGVTAVEVTGEDGKEKLLELKLR